MDEEADERARVREVLDRKPGAFEALVRDHQKLCWHIAYRMVRDADEARDVCQETFLRAHRQLHQFRFECPLRAYIARIAYSIALRYLKRNRTVPFSRLGDEEEHVVECVAVEAFDFEAVAEGQTAASLRAAVAALPAVPRTLVTLYHLEELSIPEIAGVCGMSEGTIKSHLFRARAQMAAWLRRRGVSGS